MCSRRFQLRSKDRSPDAGAIILVMKQHLVGLPSVGNPSVGLGARSSARVHAVKTKSQPQVEQPASKDEAEVNFFGGKSFKNPFKSPVPFLDSIPKEQRSQCGTTRQPSGPRTCCIVRPSVAGAALQVFNSPAGTYLLPAQGLMVCQNQRTKQVTVFQNWKMKLSPTREALDGPGRVASRIEKKRCYPWIHETKPHRSAQHRAPQRWPAQPRAAPVGAGACDPSSACSSCFCRLEW